MGQVGEETEGGGAGNKEGEGRRGNGTMTIVMGKRIQ